MQKGPIFKLFKNVVRNMVPCEKDMKHRFEECQHYFIMLLYYVSMQHQQKHNAIKGIFSIKSVISFNECRVYVNRTHIYRAVTGAAFAIYQIQLQYIFTEMNDANVIL